MPLDMPPSSSYPQSHAHPAGRGWRHRPYGSNVVFGAILVLVGGLFLMNNLGLHYFDRVWRFWPVLLIAAGVSKAFGRSDERTFGWILIFLGAVFFARHTLGFDVDLGQLWPIILILIGVSMIVRSTRGAQPATGEGALLSRLRERAMLGSVTRRNASQSFQGGELSAVLGGCDIDLREARMAGGEAVIDCFTMWGGIVIRVPAGWTVDAQVSKFAAGVDDQTRPPAQPAGRLIVRGTAIMAGVEVKN